VRNRQRDWQVFAGLLWILAALGGHWLITPANHPGAGAISVVAAWVQLVGGGGLAIWAWRRSWVTDAKPAA
jgi:hypothetical protein